MMRTLARLWHWLIEPNPAIKSLEKQYYARLLAVAIVIFLPLWMFLAGFSPNLNRSGSWANIIVFALFVIAYIILRFGYFNVAMAMTLFAAVSRVYIAAVLFDKYEGLYFLVVPIFFGAAILPLWLTVAFLGFNVLVLYAISMIQHASLVDVIGWRVVTLVTLSGVMAIWITWSRNVLEYRRQRVLAESESRYKKAFHRAESEIAERKRAEAALSAALEERSVLLKEIHHRVKNNLQTVKSLLYLQSRQFDDPILLSALEDSQNRVHSMALVHELLYQTENLKRINLKKYIARLTDSLQSAYAARAKIHVQVDDALYFNVDTAIPCGLIVNELVSNSLKYAFPDGDTGNIWITAITDDSGHIVLIIMDDGVGFPAGIDPKKSPSLGLRLVQSLTHQLRATVHFSGGNGVKVTITFAPEFFGQT